MVTRTYEPEEFDADTDEERPIAVLAERRRPVPLNVGSAGTSVRSIERPPQHAAGVLLSKAVHIGYNSRQVSHPRKVRAGRRERSEHKKCENELAAGERKGRGKSLLCKFVETNSPRTLLHRLSRLWVEQDRLFLRVRRKWTVEACQSCPLPCAFIVVHCRHRVQAVSGG